MTDPRTEVLRQTRLASELDEAELGVLAGLTTLRNLKAGETLVAEGTTDSQLYVITHGVLGVVKAAGTPDAVTLHTLAGGDFVDELGFMDGTPNYAAKVALSDLQVVGLPREKLEGVLDEHPRIVYKVMRSIVRVAHQIQRRLSMQQNELQNYIYKQHGRY
jgi:CRP/FNR family cyclic AMP-dependent transcriptional regulator